MKATVNALFLSSQARNKNNSKDIYYTLSFLDEDDNSFNTYINKDLHEFIINNLKVARFAPITIIMNIYRKADGNFAFTPIEVEKVPFVAKEGGK